MAFLPTADLLVVLRISLSASQPPFLPSLVGMVVSHSMKAQQEVSRGEQEAMEEDDGYSTNAPYINKIGRTSCFCN